MAKAKKNDTTWKKGQSGNPKGRPKGIPKSISALRSTLNKLKLLEPEAIENISKAVEGNDDVSNSQVDISKWLITTISQLTRTAIAEENYRDSIKKEYAQAMKEEEDKATGTDGVVSTTPRFRTHILEDDE